MAEIVDSVNAINNLNEAAEKLGDDPIDPLYYPEIERAIDGMAQNTAWIYERLGNTKRAKAIRKALGYNVR